MELLTTTQTAALLNIRPKTLEQWRWRGCGPRFIKVGKNCRYRKDDLETYLEGRTFESTTAALLSS